jgi:hypothetical protein
LSELVCHGLLHASRRHKNRGPLLGASRRRLAFGCKVQARSTCKRIQAKVVQKLSAGCWQVSVRVPREDPRQKGYSSQSVQSSGKINQSGGSRWRDRRSHLKVSKSAQVNCVLDPKPHGGCSHIGIAASDMKVTCQLDALRPPNKGAIRGIYSIR